MKYKRGASRENIVDRRGSDTMMSQEDREMMLRMKEHMKSEEIEAYVRGTGWPDNWQPVVNGKGDFSTMIRRRNPDNSWSFAPATPEDLFGSNDAGEGLMAVHRVPRRFD